MSCGCLVNKKIYFCIGKKYVPVIVNKESILKNPDGIKGGDYYQYALSKDAAQRVGLPQGTYICMGLNIQQVESILI